MAQRKALFFIVVAGQGSIANSHNGAAAEYLIFSGQSFDIKN